MLTPLSAALAEILERLNRCPSDARLQIAWHRQVKADAERAEPVTHHGRMLKASGRPWPGMHCQIGECACGSSLLFAFEREGEVS